MCVRYVRVCESLLSTVCHVFAVYSACACVCVCCTVISVFALSRAMLCACFHACTMLCACVFVLCGDCTVLCVYVYRVGCHFSIHHIPTRIVV